MNKSELIAGLYRYSWLLLDKQGIEIAVPLGLNHDDYCRVLKQRFPESVLSRLLLRFQPKRRQRLDIRAAALWERVEAERANSILDQVIELLQDEPPS